jgi:FKBP-type peptidyl-prolyl cis-trans isomerase 2
MRQQQRDRVFDLQSERTPVRFAAGESLLAILDQHLIEVRIRPDKGYGRARRRKCHVIHRRPERDIPAEEGAHLRRIAAALMGNPHAACRQPAAR